MDIGLNIKSLSKFIRYIIVGLMGTIIHFSTVIFLVELVHLDPVISSCLGFILTVIVSYLFNRNWTFKSTANWNKQLIKYVVVSCIGFTLNLTIVYITVDILSWYYMYGQLCVIAVIPIVNFTLNNLWTFK